MAKYDNQIGELKVSLSGAKNILIAVSANADIDRFASGLALFLAFEQSGRQVQIVSDDTIRVAQSHLFGVDHIKNTFSSGGGDLTIVLEGVVDSNGAVPALEKLDWHPDGQNLNLDFHSTSGQTFKPVNITPKYGNGGSFDLVFIIGALNLNALGNIYSANTQAFSGNIVNVDNQSGNANFGKTNVVDGNASSVSEIMVDVIPALGLPFDADIASNLLAGIFDATVNLSNQKVGADTYLAVAQALRVGGRKPQVTQSVVQESQPQVQTPKAQGLDLSALIPQTPPPQTSYIPTQDFITPSVNSQVQPAVQTSSVSAQSVPSAPVQAPSAEERPQMEGLNSADSIEIEPGWLTPKVFKGTSVG